VGFDGSDTSRAAVGIAAERWGAGGRVIVAHVAEVSEYFIETPIPRPAAPVRLPARGRAGSVEGLTDGVVCE
jgi:hypothetical protein